MFKNVHDLAKSHTCPEDLFIRHWKMMLDGTCFECQQEEEIKKAQRENRPLDSQGSTHPFNKPVL